jgi:Flp pilus assembly protein TadD
VGSQYLLVLKAVNCANGDLLASVETQTTDRNRVLDAVGKLAAEMRNRLGESLASVQRFDVPPEEVTTASLEALQAYSIGSRVMIAKNDSPAAIPLLQEAIKLDPNFAMAYTRLGINYYNLDEPVRAAENLEKAYNLKDRVSERERLYITASHDAMATGDMEAARRTFEMWQQLYPHDPFAVGNLGVVYDFLGEREKALIAFQDAHKLNPGNALVFSNVVTGYYQLNRFDEARATAAQADALHLNSNFLEANLYMVDFLQDNPSGMAKRVATLSGKPGSEDLIFYYQSDTAAYHGRFSEARAFTRRAIDSAERSDKKETAAAY